MKPNTPSGKSGTIKTASLSKKNTTIKNQEAATINNKTLIDFKCTEEALRQSEEKYRTIIQNMHDAYFECNLAGTFTFANEAACNTLGYTLDEVLRNDYRAFTTPETANKVKEVFHQTFVTGIPGTLLDYEIICRDGTTCIQQLNVGLIRNRAGNPIGFTAVSRDVTQRRHAEEELRRSEEQYRQAFSSTSDIIIILDNELNISSITPSVERIMGYKPEEITHRRIDQLNILMPASLEQANTSILRVLSGASFANTVQKFITKDGSIKFGELTASPIQKNGEVVGMIAIVRDVTERKQMEENIIKSEQKYRLIVENLQEGIFQASPYDQRLTLNPAFAAMLGYVSTEEAEKNITNIASQIYVNPDEYRKVLDIIRREGGIKGYETEFYRRDKSRIWVNMSVSSVRDSQGDLLYYHGIVEDITPKKKLEQERQNSIDSLRKSLGATINAMSATAEARDPYTAGHQRRVADLARAIATEMKLSHDQIDGIRMAGMIHDLGKISVPSEILTKPTRLTNLEMELIRTHSDAGYNILKDIDFPWPIARIVLEHHERIDGSGYPNGLKEKEILLESKIISIADVVEAISSNRPYRPALGIGPALDEIVKNSGILYDATAAEACLKLFRENQYKMPE